MTNTLHIFISSPGDVGEERERARQVVEQLRRRYAGQFDLKSVLWEDLPLHANMSFQQGIDLVLSNNGGIHVAIFILWSRLGSPLGHSIRKADGSVYRSGTERELDLMVAAQRLSQIGPKVLVYRRQDSASFDERLRGRTTDEQADLIAQKMLLEAFIQETFQNAADGSNARAIHNFDNPGSFSQKLRVHLQDILDALAQGFDANPAWDIERKGSPFRGLKAFEFEHSPVFFGREDEVLEVRRALQKKAREGCAFVLISGASGSGKSSLARAGVVPAVVDHEIDGLVSSWRHAVCSPSEFKTGLCSGLAELLCSAAVLPELKVAADSVAVLANGLSDNPNLTLAQSIRPALTRAGQGKAGAVRLILLVDQLEELFTGKNVDDKDRGHFVAALDCFARSGVIWVIATVRSDFYQQCQSLPVLMKMKEGGGQIDLLPPQADAMRRLIECPARLAGLSFQIVDGKLLSDRILAGATGQGELLPLLSYVLRELFVLRDAKNQLTFDAYKTLNGVEGALAKRVNDVFTELPKTVRDQLPEVLRALVNVVGDEKESVVRQRVPLDKTFPAKSDARQLVDAFISERFFSTGLSPDGVGTVAVAHEALLRAWKLAVDWIKANREFLRIRARVVARMNEGSRLLEGDPLLESASLQLRTSPKGFTNEQVAFINDCVRIAHKNQERRQRRRTQVTAMLATLLAMAVVAGFWVWTLKGKAEKQTALATNESVKRLMQLREAAQSDRLIAQDLFGQGRGPEALAHLARATRYDPSNHITAEMAVVMLNDWLYPLPSAIHIGKDTSAVSLGRREEIVTSVLEDTVKIRDSMTGTILTTLHGHSGPVSRLALSPDAERVVGVLTNKTALVWNARDGKVLATLRGHECPLGACAFSDDHRLIAGVADTVFNRATCTNNLAWVWNTDTGELLATFSGHTNSIYAPSFSRDSRWMVTPSFDQSARVWDVSSGTVKVVLVDTQSMLAASFSPDSSRVVTAGGTSILGGPSPARVWDTQNGRVMADLLGHTGLVYTAEFSSEGRRVVTASQDRTARIWDAESGKTLAVLRGHEQEVQSAHFSSNNQQVVTSSGESGSTDKAIRIWDWNHCKLVVTLRGHTNGLTSVEFSPDGSRVLTASYDGTARIWDSNAGDQMCKLEGQYTYIHFAQYDTTGQRVVGICGKGTGSGHVVCVWNTVSGKRLAIFDGHTNAVLLANISHDSRRVVTASQDKTAILWDVDSGRRLLTLAHTNVVFSAQFSPDDTRVLTRSWNGGGDFYVRLWNALDGKPVLHTEGSFLEFNPGGQYLVTNSRERGTVVWDSKTGNDLGTVSGIPPAFPGKNEQYEIVQREESPASGSKNSWEWRVSSMQSNRLALLARSWGGKSNGLDYYMLPSPDGRYVASASDDKGVEVWDSSGSLIGILPLQSRIHFSQDGLRMLTISEDNTARIWEMCGSAAEAPDWFADFLELLAQQKLGENGELKTVPPDEFMTLRAALLPKVVGERSRHAAIARWFLLPSAKLPSRPGRE